MVMPLQVQFTYAYAIAGFGYAFWGNLFAARSGSVPALLNDLAVQHKPNALQKASLWSAFFDQAKSDMIKTLPLNCAAAGYLAYLAAPSSKARVLFSVASVLTLLAGPFTAVALGPTNASIQHIVDSGNNEIAEDNIDVLLRKWKANNDIRMFGLFGTSWACVVAATVMQL